MHSRALRAMGWEGFSAAAAWLLLLVSWETQGGPAGRAARKGGGG